MTSIKPMLSNKPYLIRAFYEWIVDSGCTPYVAVNAMFPRCNVPQQFVENGQITLNISPTAVRDLKITNDVVEFRASFSGIVHLISAPIKAILAIYAQEDEAQGMFFDYEDADAFDIAEFNALPNSTPPIPGNPNEPSKGKPNLRLVD